MSTDRIFPQETTPASAVQPDLWLPYTWAGEALKRLGIPSLLPPAMVTVSTETQTTSEAKEKTAQTPGAPQPGVKAQDKAPPPSAPRGPVRNFLSDWNPSRQNRDTTGNTTRPLLPRIELLGVDDKRPKTIAREEFLRGGMKDGTWNTLQFFGATRQDFDEVRKEINKFGADPLTVWTNAMRDSRVLGIGEMHKPGSPHRKFTNSHFPELAKAGATHFAIELPFDAQRNVMKAIDTGMALDPTLDEFFRDNPDMLEMIQSAHKAGLKVVAVDLNEKASSNTVVNNPLYKLTRDECMAKKIDEILTADPTNKVVYWCGGLHLTDPVKGRDKQSLSAGEILKKKYPVTTLYDQTQFHRQTIALLANDISTPVAVPTAKAEKLAGLSINPPGSSWNVKYGSWDYIFIYPSK